MPFGGSGGLEAGGWEVGLSSILTAEILLSLGDVMAGEIDIFGVGNVDRKEEEKASISGIFC